MLPSSPMRAAQFRSAYGPKYQYEPNFHGWNKTALLRLGARTAMYGGALGFGALFFVSGIPRIRVDILQNVPFLGRYFVKEDVDPADNPF
ncbi:hypothetical protein CDD82_2934 [Ophiocordyceps australis]|uniref:Cytochrome b-c1 complex subunit 10 n=1 Tax=Ophiocordyceps australis TaxID=1399860 RepID=A0A2C5ZHF2_9HYPO|nr:hypothetical protein CDD82_2934 [Ophiocordyceps australis]